MKRKRFKEEQIICILSNEIGPKGRDDFNHRMVQRAKLWHSREWLEVVPTFRPYLVHQESVFLLPAAFSPLR